MSSVTMHACAAVDDDAPSADMHNSSSGGDDDSDGKDARRGDVYDGEHTSTPRSCSSSSSSSGCHDEEDDDDGDSAYTTMTASSSSSSSTATAEQWLSFASLPLVGLAGQHILCMRAMAHVCVVGTNEGAVALVDVARGRVTRIFYNHSEAIRDIDCDAPCRFVASCDYAGDVVVQSLTDAKDTWRHKVVGSSSNNNKEGISSNSSNNSNSSGGGVCSVQSVALHAAYTRQDNCAVVYASEDAVVLLLSRPATLLLPPRRSTTVLCRGLGRVLQVRYNGSGSLLAWLTERALCVYSYHDRCLLRALARPLDMAATPELYPCTLLWEGAHTVLCGWADWVQELHVRPHTTAATTTQQQPTGSHSSHTAPYVVEAVTPPLRPSATPHPYRVCGLAPFGAGRYVLLVCVLRPRASSKKAKQQQQRHMLASSSSPATTAPSPPLLLRQESVHADSDDGDDDVDDVCGVEVRVVERQTLRDLYRGRIATGGEDDDSSRRHRRGDGAVLAGYGVHPLQMSLTYTQNSTLLRDRSSSRGGTQHSTLSTTSATPHRHIVNKDDDKDDDGSRHGSDKAHVASASPITRYTSRTVSWDACVPQAATPPPALTQQAGEWCDGQLADMTHSPSPTRSSATAAAEAAAATMALTRDGAYHTGDRCRRSSSNRGADDTTTAITPARRVCDPLTDYPPDGTCYLALLGSSSSTGGGNVLAITPCDADDHVDYLLQGEQYDEAYAYAQQRSDKLHRHTLASLALHLVEVYLQRGCGAYAAAQLPRLLAGHDTASWEQCVCSFCAHHEAWRVVDVLRSLLQQLPDDVASSMCTTTAATTATATAARDEDKNIATARAVALMDRSYYDLVLLHCLRHDAVQFRHAVYALAHKCSVDVVAQAASIRYATLEADEAATPTAAAAAAVQQADEGSHGDSDVSGASQDDEDDNTHKGGDYSSEDATTSPQRQRTALAEAYAWLLRMQGQDEVALRVLLRGGSVACALALVREGGYVAAVLDTLPDLLRRDRAATLQLLLEHVPAETTPATTTTATMTTMSDVTSVLAPESVVARLAPSDRRALFVYVRALRQQRPAAFASLATRHAQLFATLYMDYARDEVLPFLRDMAPHLTQTHALYALCVKYDLLEAAALLLGRLGRDEEALRVLVVQLHDVRKAVEFVAHDAAVSPEEQAALFRTLVHMTLDHHASLPHYTASPLAQGMRYIVHTTRSRDTYASVAARYNTDAHLVYAANKHNSDNNTKNKAKGDTSLLSWQQQRPPPSCIVPLHLLAALLTAAAEATCAQLSSIDAGYVVQVLPREERGLPGVGKSIAVLLRSRARAVALARSALRAAEADMALRYDALLRVRNASVCVTHNVCAYCHCPLAAVPPSYTAWQAASTSAAADSSSPWQPLSARARVLEQQRACGGTVVFRCAHAYHAWCVAVYVAKAHAARLRTSPLPHRVVEFVQHPQRFALHQAQQRRQHADTSAAAATTSCDAEDNDEHDDVALPLQQPLCYCHVCESTL